jgi:hypothetical protein
MIKAVVQKTTYLVYDTKSDLSLTLIISDDKIKFLNENGDKEFVFQSDNTTNVQEKWKGVIKLMEKESS